MCIGLYRYVVVAFTSTRDATTANTRHTCHGDCTEIQNNRHKFI